MKGELDADTKLRFAGGHEAGKYANDLFPGGIEIPYEGMSHEDQLVMTQNELAKGSKTIYEATFSHNDIFVKLDILHKGPKGWEMYEVKASNEFKGHYLNDVSIQYYVAAGSGLPIEKASIIYLNSKYIRNGPIEPKKLFVSEDITRQVKDNQAFIKANIGHIRKMLLGSRPEIDIGRYCEDPYECDFMDFCREHLPEPSVFDLCGSITRTTKSAGWSGSSRTRSMPG